MKATYGMAGLCILLFLSGCITSTTENSQLSHNWSWIGNGSRPAGMAHSVWSDTLANPLILSIFNSGDYIEINLICPQTNNSYRLLLNRQPVIFTDNNGRSTELGLIKPTPGGSWYFHWGKNYNTPDAINNISILNINTSNIIQNIDIPTPPKHGQYHEKSLIWSMPGEEDGTIILG